MCDLLRQNLSNEILLTLDKLIFDLFGSFRFIYNTYIQPQGKLPEKKKIFNKIDKSWLLEFPFGQRLQ